MILIVHFSQGNLWHCPSSKDNKSDVVKLTYWSTMQIPQLFLYLLLKWHFLRHGDKCTPCTCRSHYKVYSHLRCNSSRNEVSHYSWSRRWELRSINQLRRVYWPCRDDALISDNDSANATFHAIRAVGGKFGESLLSSEMTRKSLLRNADHEVRIPTRT